MQKPSISATIRKTIISGRPRVSWTSSICKDIFIMVRSVCQITVIKYNQDFMGFQWRDEHKWAATKKTTGYGWILGF